jgi:selenocysteine lyase/cysteine desulfurase
VVTSLKELFSIDPGVAYLNAAYMTPLPHNARLAGEAGMAEKSKPWLRDRMQANNVVEETRSLAAKLIGASQDDIAIVGSVSYGLATACRNIHVERGSRILIVENEHFSMMLAMARLAESTGATLDVVPQPPDGDWTAAILARLDAPGPPISLAALTPVHWAGGTMIDLDRIAPRLHQVSAVFLVDATQTAGILPLDVARLKPDFVTFPAYKWLLGPYGLAFLYVAPHRQNGAPLEEHAFNREGIKADASLSPYLTKYLPGARRFDRGERDSYITIPMTHAGMTLLAQQDRAQLAGNLGALTDDLARDLTARDVKVAGGSFRSPHILSFALSERGGAELAAALEAAKIFTSIRYGMCRVSPHLYNDADDMARLSEKLRRWRQSA